MLNYIPETYVTTFTSGNGVNFFIIVYYAKTLETMKSEGFDKFWNDTFKLSEKLGVEVPELKRQRKKPAKFLDSSDEDEEKFHL